MKIKHIIAFSGALLFVMGQSMLSVCATVGTEPLQSYFSDDGTVMKIFTSSPLNEDTEILIGNETLDVEVVNTDVQVRTVFLIDNSTSMPYSLREEVTTAISDYVSIMPKSESVKVVIFDTQTTVLADEYSSDREFINYELSKVDFKGKASLVYDSVINVIDTTDNSQDVYYRTVLITDGVDSVEGTSFDYMRSVISENGRYHIDVVQVSEGNKQDVNLIAIANLGSNTYTFFNSGTKFDSLVPRNVSLAKVNLTDSVTTGELKGVTIKSGENSIALGSILFPQVVIPSPETEPEEVIVETEETEETTEEVTEIVTEMVTETAPEQEDSSAKAIWIAFGILAVLGGGVGVFFLLKKFNLIPSSKPVAQCKISVRITKEDDRDNVGVGSDTWIFPVSSEFRVGRISDPVSDGVTLPKNDKAICEYATNEDISSIGRNAFALKYDKRNNVVIITNIAQRAVFSVKTDDKEEEIKCKQSSIITKGSHILLGNYTTVTICNVTII